MLPANDAWVGRLGADSETDETADLAARSASPSADAAAPTAGLFALFPCSGRRRGI